MKSKTIAVILVAHGEAETARFVENYRVSLHTLQRASGIIPVPLPLRHFISFSSSLRKRFSGKASGSPQNPVTRLQAAALQAQLDRVAPALCPGLSFEVMAAFSASDPCVESVLEKTKGYAGRVVIPMAPVDNAMSCGLLCEHLSGTCTPEELSRMRVVGRLWSDRSVHRAYLDHLFGSDCSRPSGAREGNVLMLLFHGTLVEDRYGAAPAFRTGHDETVEFSRQLASLIESDARNPWGTVVTAFLNHDVGGRWSQPSFGEACRMLDAGGVRHVSLFAAGYFSDGNETVHRAESLSLEMPSVRVESLPCLNGSTVFISFLAEKTMTAARQILAFSGESDAGTV